jgi:hypothetical protein
MPVDFSVKRVPDRVASRLRERARRNRRSLQRELLCILEAAAAESGASRVAEPAVKPYASEHAPEPRGGSRRAKGRLSLDELWERARRLGDPIPGEPATSIVRRDRDERSRH